MTVRAAMVGMHRLRGMPRQSVDISRRADSGRVVLGCAVCVCVCVCVVGSAGMGLEARVCGGLTPCLF